MYMHPFLLVYESVQFHIRTYMYMYPFSDHETEVILLQSSSRTHHFITGERERGRRGERLERGRCRGREREKETEDEQNTK